MLGLGSYISDHKGDRFDLSDVSGLVSWLQSGSGYTGTVGEAVSSWFDRARHLSWSQSESSQRPTIVANGGLNFDGANDALDAGTQISLTTFHLFMVIDLEGANNETAIGVNASTNFLRFFKGGNLNQMRYKFGSDGPVDKNVTASSNIPTTKFLFELSRTNAASNNLTTIFDGTAVSTDTLDVAKDWIIRSVGAQSPTGANPTQGIIYELAIYNNVLSGDNLTNARADIQARNDL